jgi:hypothetical protein
VSTSTRRSFPANYAGACGTCPAPISVGDRVFYATQGSEHVSGLDCCGDRPDDDLAPARRADDGLTADDETPADAIARVMPRGRTARDACGTCWQIPSTNGSCGCGN